MLCLKNLGRELRGICGSEAWSAPVADAAVSIAASLCRRPGCGIHTPGTTAHPLGAPYCQMLLAREKPEELRTILAQRLAALWIAFKIGPAPVPGCCWCCFRRRRGGRHRGFQR